MYLRASERTHCCTLIEIFVYTYIYIYSVTKILHNVRSLLRRIIGECGRTLCVGMAHAVQSTNTKFKPLLLSTQAGMPYTNTHKHRTSYYKSTLTFLGPAKRWKSICAARQKPEILAVLRHNI